MKSQLDDVINVSFEELLKPLMNKTKKRER